MQITEHTRTHLNTPEHTRTHQHTLVMDTPAHTHSVSQALTHPAQGMNRSSSYTNCLVEEKKEQNVSVKTRQNQKSQQSCCDCTAPCLSPLALQDHVLFSLYVVMTLEGAVGCGGGRHTGLSIAFGKSFLSWLGSGNELWGSCQPWSAEGEGLGEPWSQRCQTTIRLESLEPKPCGHQRSCWVSLGPLQCKLALV